MTTACVSPEFATGRFAAWRATLNARASAFAARATDVDAEGRVFRVLLCVQLVLAGLRLVYVLACGVPIFEPDILRTYLGAIAILPLLWATTRFRLAEATLVLRAGLLTALCYPFFETLCVDIFYTGRGFPLADAAFAAADHAIGFDWLAYARLVDTHPWLWAITSYGYDSILVQFGGVIALMAFSRSASRLYAYLLAQTLALTTVAFIALFLPAIGAYAQAGAAHVHWLHAFKTADIMTPSISWLRAGATGPGGVDVFTLISFPSFHSCCAVLFAWAVWHIPYVRWVGLVLDLAMLAGTPVHGSHYLVDVLAGIAIAAGAIVVSTAVVARIDRWTSRRSQYQNAAIPVIARPNISACTSDAPS